MSRAGIIERTGGDGIEGGRDNPEIPDFDDNAAGDDDVGGLASRWTSGNRKGSGWGGGLVGDGEDNDNEYNNNEDE